MEPANDNFVSCINQSLHSRISNNCETFKEQTSFTGSSRLSDNSIKSDKSTQKRNSKLKSTSFKSFHESSDENNKDFKEIPQRK